MALAAPTPPSTAASSDLQSAATTSSSKQFALPLHIHRRHRKPTNPFDTDDASLDGSISTSTSRAELYSPASTPPPSAGSQRSTARHLAPQANLAPAVARLNGCDHPIYHFSNLDQLSMAILRQRAMRLRDVLERPARERNAQIPFGAPGEPLPADRKVLQAWIMDAQLVLIRLAGHDPRREWSATTAFGAPRDLVKVTDASQLESGLLPTRNQTAVLTPVSMDWVAATSEGRIAGVPMASPRMAAQMGRTGAPASGNVGQWQSARPHTAPPPPTASSQHERASAEGGGRHPPRADLPDVSLPVMR